MTERIPNHNRQKKAAVINDFTGFGRCSLTVELPILSVMGVQCCPLPTAVFSNHTGFPHFFYSDYTEHMEEYAREWKGLDLHFAGISTGFLGSVEQIDIVRGFLTAFKTEETRVLVDPVMGDYGRLYATYTEEMAGRMHELAACADLLTPNLTEACILTGTPYREDFTPAELESLCRRLTDLGPAQVVISGIPHGDTLLNFIYECGIGCDTVSIPRIGGNRSGTGDVFSAVLTADMVNGVPLRRSVERACRFICNAIQHTIALGVPETDGLCIEECLWELGREAFADRSMERKNNE